MPIPASLLERVETFGRNLDSQQSHRGKSARLLLTMRTLRSRRRFIALPRLEMRTPLVAIAVATTVLEEASVWLGTPLPLRYTAGLAHRARRCYAHCASFRRRVDRRGTAGRETLYVFMRHWLCARLHEERPDLLARLPADYRTGAELPTATPTAPAVVPLLSNDARLLASFG